MKLEPFAVLSESDIQHIHNATLDILSGCGIKILGTRLLDALKAKGLPVDEKNQTVRFPHNILENALATVPPQIEVRDREGAPAFVLGDGAPKIAAGHNAVFWLDAETGETRPSRVADVERFARLCEQLQHIDMIGIPVMPQDVPNPKASLLHAVKACVENSRKPIFFSTDNAPVNRGCIELLRAAFAGDLDKHVYGISQLSPTSPLFWEENVCEAILDTLTTAVPLAILPEPNAGVSAPYTLAGLLTMNNAECLSGLAMIQLLKPGHPVMYANSWTATDMRSGAALVGSIETSVCRIAGAQLARFYGVPSHTTAPNSDNHAHDEQNAWEKTFSLMAAVGADNDLIVNCGMFACGMTCSDEQLLMDAEIAGMCRRMAAGVEVTPETIAAELIKRIGPQGETYLTQDHTLERLRSAEFLGPDLAVRGPFSSWQAAGSRDTAALARERAAKLADDNHGLLDARRTDRLRNCFTDIVEENELVTL
ncbi:MAG: trimethylamine methyltransferase family protein [Candidatus Pacebacteria bacterium]|nr:trimethylamine methyltransferase family protein [Candidatus Paceibacterota bacterium]